MALEDFMGGNCDKVFVRSQEESDVEDEIIEEEPPAARLTQCEDDGEITAIPLEFLIQGRPKIGKHKKHFLEYRKFIGVEVEMVNSLPWDVDGIHKYKILCEEDEWHNKVKDGRW